jgi:hypothetical protein
VSQNSNQPQRTAPILRASDVQLIHAHQHINLLQGVLQAVRDDLRHRAEIGSYDGDHDYQLSNSILDRLCEVTE